MSRRPVVNGVDDLGFVMLERTVDGDALLFDATAGPTDAAYAIVGNYAQGEPCYFTSFQAFHELAEALEAFPPDSLQTRSVEWLPEDFASAIQDAYGEEFVKISDSRVAELVNRCDRMRHWQEDAIAAGNDLIAGKAREMAEEGWSR